MNKQGRNRILKKYIPKNKMLNTEPWASMTRGSNINEFYKVTDAVFREVNGKFNELWNDIKKLHKEPVLVWNDNTDEKATKQIMLEVVNKVTKYYLYGLLYETAKYDNLSSFENLAIEYDKDRDEYYLNDKMGRGYPILISSDIIFLAETMLTIIEGNSKKFEELILQYENKQGKYDKRIFKTAYGIQKENEGKRPKVTDEDAIILANQKLKIYPENDFIDNNGQKTITLFNITKTYSNHHKPQLKKKSKSQ